MKRVFPACFWAAVAIIDLRGAGRSHGGSQGVASKDGATASAEADDRRCLVGHWKLQGDCQDHSGRGNHGVDLATGTFDGKGAHIEVPASGTVTVDGVPLEGDSVMSMPNIPNPDGETSHGVSGPDGRYEVKTEGHIGVVPGKYRVKVSKKPPLDPELIPDEFKDDPFMAEMLIPPERKGRRKKQDAAPSVEMPRRDLCTRSPAGRESHRPQRHLESRGEGHVEATERPLTALFFVGRSDRLQIRPGSLEMDER